MFARQLEWCTASQGIERQASGTVQIGFNPIAGRPYRVLYIFDPRRVALLLLGDDKTGDDRTELEEENSAKDDEVR